MKKQLTEFNRKRTVLEANGIATRNKKLRTGLLASLRTEKRTLLGAFSRVEALDPATLLFMCATSTERARTGRIGFRGDHVRVAASRREEVI